MKISHYTENEALCGGVAGGIEALAGDNHPFDYNALVNVANGVINHPPGSPYTTSPRPAGDPNWQVAANRGPIGDATYSRVEQAMVSISAIYSSYGEKEVNELICGSD